MNKQQTASESVSLHDQLLAQLLFELSDRAGRGESVDIGVVCQQHPEVATELRQLWSAVIAAAAAGDDSEQGAADRERDSAAFDGDLPRRFGDYELLEEIGRGGMGVVYRAYQISLGREVAIKMISLGSAALEEAKQRFQTEATAAAALDHPGVVPVYEVGQFEGRPYFSMKYISGQTLAQRLAEGPLPAREAARILAEVSRTIHFAHQRGVLHRDLKPSNILLDKRGKPLISDFGLAKQVSAKATTTQTGAVLGTPAYMSPEQAAAVRGQVGPSSDVYSLGSILYHMLTGRPPFQAASVVDTMLLVLEQDPAPPRLLNPKADADLEMIALRCLQKPADLRYPTADALAQDLEAYLNNEPISARSGRFAHVLARWLRETHHAPVLENWGVLWMWHSLAIFVACALTNALQLQGVTNRWYYFWLWTAGFGAWAAVFWALRRRQGPVTFVERQIAHVWAASIISIAALFPLEYWLGLDVLTLSPVLGLSNAMVFLVKAGILSGAFYVQAVLLFLTAGAMALWPTYAHLIFGAVSAGCFFFPGLKYYRQRVRSQNGS